MVVCSLCKRDGHLKKDCPEDFKKVQLDPLPPVTPEFLSVLNKVCEQCYSEYYGTCNPYLHCDVIFLLLQILVIHTMTKIYKCISNG